MLSRRFSRISAVVAVATLGILASCGREPSGVTGAGVSRVAAIAFNTAFPASYVAFQSAGSSVVEFTRVRVVINNPDGSVAVDTVISFPPGTEELPVTLNAVLPPNSSGNTAPLSLKLRYVNAAGDTVFSGGPVSFNAIIAPPGSPAPPAASVEVPVTYTGPGSTAAMVRISPSARTVTAGDAFTFTAQALDASGNPMANVPIVFASESPAVATIGATTGAGVAGPARGTARIVAQLLTGQLDAALLTVKARAASIAIASGNGQSAKVNEQLAAPAVVRVTAADGSGVDGVTVTFAAQNGGTAGPASATTDANGNAQTTWRLGPAAGPQSLTATAAGLTGSPLAFTATARGINAVRLDVAAPPPSTIDVGARFAVTIRALTVDGEVAPGFTGPVTLTPGPGSPAGSELGGTTTVNAVSGVATFTDLYVTRPGSHTISAASGTLTGVTTAPFTATAGGATRLAFESYPAAATAGTNFSVITVVALDDFGNTASSFTGAVTLTVNAPVRAELRAAGRRGLAGRTAARALAQQTTPPLASLMVSGRGSTSNVAVGPPTVNAVAGVATFTNVQSTVAGEHSITASAAGLGSITSPTFIVKAGAAAALQVVSGNGQSAAAGATLALPIVVRLTDTFGNAVSGPSVTFTPTSGHGTASPTSAAAGSGGLAQTSWTLEGTAGAKTMSVASAGVSPIVVNATVTGGTGPTGPPYGWPEEFPGASSHAPNYLLGTMISVPAGGGVLTHLSTIGKAAGPMMKLALYTDSEGSPNTLVAQTAAVALTVGPNEVPVTQSFLPAGNYWIMGIFETNASIGISFPCEETVKYISHTFSSPLPTTFPTPTVYSCQRFNYYIRLEPPK